MEKKHLNSDHCSNRTVVGTVICCHRALLSDSVGSVCAVDFNNMSVWLCSLGAQNHVRLLPFMSLLECYRCDYGDIVLIALFDYWWLMCLG